jgi:hypothetical protein
VVAKLACPANARTVVNGTSARIHNTIAVARKSWNRSPGQPNSPTSVGHRTFVRKFE